MKELSELWFKDERAAGIQQSDTETLSRESSAAQTRLNLLQTPAGSSFLF